MKRLALIVFLVLLVFVIGVLFMLAFDVRVEGDLIYYNLPWEEDSYEVTITLCRIRAEMQDGFRFQGPLYSNGGEPVFYDPGCDEVFDVHGKEIELNIDDYTPVLEYEYAFPGGKCFRWDWIVRGEFITEEWYCLFGKGPFDNPYETEPESDSA